MENLIKIRMEGLNCANCAGLIEQRVKKLKYVKNANLNFSTKKIFINFGNTENLDEKLDEIVTLINSIEPGLDILVENGITGKISKVKVDEDGNSVLCRPEGEHTDANCDEKCTGSCCGHSHSKAEESSFSSALKSKGAKPVIAGIVFYIIGIYIQHIIKNEDGAMLFFMIAYLVCGLQIIKKAFSNIGKGSIFDENLLMTIATIGAAAIGQYPEAAGVMMFYRIGEFFQDMAVNKSRKNIKDLMEIMPEFANVVCGNNIEKKNPQDVNIGDVILVKPGEKVPLDGEIISGNTLLDTSAITGESVLRTGSEGDYVNSGVINTEGTIKIKVDKAYSESTVSKIMDMVENAGSRKAKTENFISVFAKYYTPFVVLAAILITVLPSALLGEPVAKWLYRGLVFLVVSCPCALVLSIPLSYFAGIGVASRNGILVKGGNYLEVLKDVKKVVFDKTGTLTQGVFEVVDINAETDMDSLMKAALITESGSNHPIAKSVIKYASSKVSDFDFSINDIEDYKEISARGVLAKYKGSVYLAGNEKLMKDNEIDYTENKKSGTLVYIAKDSEFLGSIVISDRIKDTTEKGIAELKKAGVNDLYMLTGDNSNVADEVASEIGINNVYSELLPVDKVEILEKICSENGSGKVVFVGDGVNDAPVLARADAGIAMGGVGSDAAIEAADVVIMTDDITKIAKSIEIAKKTNSIVIQNIVFALGVKAIVLVLGALGYADMWLAIFADVGVAVLAVLNSMRINIRK